MSNKFQRIMVAICVFHIAIQLFSISEVSSADIQIGAPDGPIVPVMLDGEIKSGDAAKMNRLLEILRQESRVPIVSLSSPGGSFVEGVHLARVFMEHQVGTLVRDGAICYSACAIAFLGGHSKLNPWRSMQPLAKIGFHAPALSMNEASYSKDIVESAYELAINSMNESISLAYDAGVHPANLPMLFVPSKNQFYKVEFVFDATNLNIEIKQTRMPTRFTISMARNACVNQDSGFHKIWRLWRNDGNIRKLGDPTRLRRTNEQVSVKPHIFRDKKASSLSIAIPDTWLGGGHDWCFLKASFKDSQLTSVSCLGRKWLPYDQNIQAAIARIAEKTTTENLAQFGQFESCSSIGNDTSNNPQFLVPPTTLISDIQNALDAYERSEAPLIP